ncbi:hypothetical protein DEU56DRAFT_842511 [Suillus clintonianus]|uniref:uncharacterized protein n=1 Tax=Suillus clintonianus TaxID=1904413 RepID=UPI001B86CD9F|nr:uncharacterized protein DEU56DRAFT_842511 [Suillus clintonianus]KAG2112846.1 hypothetical protein DEU56DRAFT_842511 [Suillus clintonianus]
MGRIKHQAAHILFLILLYPLHCSFYTSGKSLNYVFSGTKLAGVSRFHFFSNCDREWYLPAQTAWSNSSSTNRVRPRHGRFSYL